MNSKRQRDLQKVEKREKTFSTLARKEGQGAAQRAKKEAKEGLKESAKDSRFETKVDRAFANLRAQRAAHYKKMEGKR